MDLFADNKSSEDVFYILFETSLIKSLFVIIFILLSILNFLLLYGIIWFERFGSDQKRTLMNELLSSISWVFIFLIIWYFIKQLTCKLQFSLDLKVKFFLQLLSKVTIRALQ